MAERPSRLEYQTPGPPTSPDLAPIIALVLGAGGCVLDLLLWRGVFAGAGIFVLPVAATAVLGGVIGLLVGIEGTDANSRSAHQLSLVAVGFSLLCVLSWLCMAAWFVGHLPAI